MTDGMTHTPPLKQMFREKMAANIWFDIQSDLNLPTWMVDTNVRVKVSRIIKDSITNWIFENEDKMKKYLELNEEWKG